MKTCKLLFILLFVFISTFNHAISSNLVYNGSFENVDPAQLPNPNWGGQNGPFPGLSGWNVIHLSPDCFSPATNSVPGNFMTSGPLYAKDGNNYGGLSMGRHYGNYIYEEVSADLKAYLKSGNKYKISLWAATGTTRKTGINLTCHLYDEGVNHYEMVANFEVIQSSSLNNWVYFEAEFTVPSGYDFDEIRFTGDPNTKYTLGYVFFDDVQLIALDDIKLETEVRDFHLCAGDELDVYFDYLSGLDANTKVIVQLSDKYGRFINPTILAERLGAEPRIIRVKIPENTTSGSGYRIRVVTENPEYEGTDNGINITISNMKDVRIFGEVDLCVPAEENYEAYPKGDYNYKWSVENGTIKGSNRANNIDVDWENPGIGTVKLVVEDNNTGCKDSTEIEVNLQEMPEVDFEGDFLLCKGDNGEYYLPESEKYHFEWIVEGGEIIGSDKTDRINVKWNSDEAWIKLKVRLKDKVNCEQLIGKEIKFVEFPEINIEGDLKLCKGMNGEYYFETDNDYEISWTVEEGKIISGQDTKRISVEWTGENPKVILSLSMKEEPFCSNRFEVNIELLEGPITDILGDREVCLGETVVYTCGNENNVSNIWSVDEGIMLSAANESKFTVQFDKSGIQKIKLIRQFEPDGCIDSTEIEIVVLEAADIDISGEIDVCLGHSAIYKAVGDDIVSYKWELENGLIIGNANEAELEVNWEQLTTGKVKLKIIDVNGCENETEIIVNVHEAEKPIITAESFVICQGSELELYIENDTYTSYEWSTGETTSTIKIDKAGTYSVKVIDQWGCEAESDEITIEEGSIDDVFILGEEIICEGSSTILSLNDDYYEYLWSTGETTSTISVSQAGKYSVIVKDSKGCEGSAEFVVEEYIIDFEILNYAELEFDEILVGREDTKTFTIQNNSNASIKFNIQINEEVFEVIPDNLELKENEKKKFTIIFKPDFPKYYTDKVIFNITEPCVDEFEYEINGAGYIYSEVKIHDLISKPGKDTSIKISARLLDFDTPLELNYVGDFLYNKNYLLIDDFEKHSSDINKVEVNGNARVNTVYQGISSIKCLILLGPNTNSTIQLNDFSWDNKYVRVIKYDGRVDENNICARDIRNISLVKTEINVVPNPASDFLKLKIINAREGVYNLSVISLEGLEKLNKSLNIESYNSSYETELPIDELESGSYFIRIIYPGGVLDKKVIIKK